MWLAEATIEEKPEMEKWDKVVDIIQYAFREGMIPVECVWKTAVLIRKGNRELCGIGTVEVIWVAMSGVVNFWIRVAVNFHNTLHGFRTGRGTGTTSFGVKLF